MLDGPEQAPVKAKAVESVRICSLYGGGFFYVPGTDACIKIGGYLRTDTTFNEARMAHRAGTSVLVGTIVLPTTLFPATVWR
jgi:hypothetical protein